MLLSNVEVGSDGTQSSGPTPFDSVLRSIPIGIALVDKSGRFVVANDFLAKLHRKSSKELQGKTIFELFPEWADSIQKNIQQVFLSGQSVMNEPLNGEAKLDSPPGRHWVISLFPVYQSNELNLLGMSLVDNTEFFRREETLRSLANELARSNRKLEQFSYLIANELCEPLQKVTSCLSLLNRRRKEICNSTTRSYLNLALSGAKQMKVELEFLLRAARVDFQKVGTNFVSLDGVVDEVRGDLKERIHRKRLKIVVKRLPLIVGDRAQLLHLFTYLFNCFVEGSEASSEIYLKAEADDRVFWKVTIEEKRKEPIEKSNEESGAPTQKLTRQNRSVRTLMHFSICRRLVEKQGGKFWLSSNHNQGTKVSLTLRG